MARERYLCNKHKYLDSLENLKKKEMNEKKVCEGYEERQKLQILNPFPQTTQTSKANTAQTHT